MQRKQFAKNDLDKLVMLLSADWFFEHWALIGVPIEKKERMRLQKGCQAILQQIMSGTTQYWLVSFSTDRIERTLQSFQQLLSTVKIEDAVRRRINALVSRKNDARTDDASRWLLTHITQMLSNESEELETLPLNPAIREKVVQAWTTLEIELEQVDFRDLAARSNSSWDQYLRSITPDLPTYVCDYLMVEIIGDSKFEVVWQLIRHKLNPKERNELLNWYRAAGHVVSGTELTISYLDDTVH